MKLGKASSKLGRLYKITADEGLMVGVRTTVGSGVKILDKTLKKMREALLLPYFELRSRNGLILKTVQGSKMYLAVDDPGISRELLLTGVHETRTTDLVKAELQEGMVVVDIGANLGYYCLLEALLVGNRGKVYAIEPVPRNFELLCRSIEANGYENIRTCNLAISDKAGTAKFALTDASNWGTMIDWNSEDKSDYIKERMGRLCREFMEVEAVSLDKFLEKENEHNVNFIRMDIEGYEVEAIRGMMKTLERCPPPVKLLIEVHNSVFSDPRQSLGLTFEKLLLLGFRPKVLIAKKDVYYDLKEEEFISILCSYNTIVCHLLMEK